jgi:hypothetical protein
VSLLREFIMLLKGKRGRPCGSARSLCIFELSTVSQRQLQNQLVGMLMLDSQDANISDVDLSFH